MNRSEFLQRLAARSAWIKPRDVEEAGKVLLQAMSSALASGDRIEVRGFGSFSLYIRNPRTGRNPKTGESVHVPAKRVLHFKPGKKLRGDINR